MRLRCLPCLAPLIALTIARSAVQAQASPMVDPDARVYRDIDRLAAAGLIDTLIVGSRPFSQHEVLHLLGEARHNIGRLGNDGEWAVRVIAADSARWAPHALRAIDEARIEADEVRSLDRPAPSDPNGSIVATINPLAADRLQRPLSSNGVTGLLETTHSASLGRHLAVEASPEFSGVAGGGARGELRTANADLLFGNFSIEIGRTYGIFGQSPTGGLLLSENAPSLDMIRLSNDRPAGLPWLLRYLGPIKGTVFVAQLRSLERPSHPRLIGYHISILPHPNFEFGVQVLDEMGGGGGPAASFGDRLEDVVPLIDALFRTRSDFLFSNKFAGVDFHWRVPRARGFELYGEGTLDDFELRRFAGSLLDDGGYIAGFAFSCLAECGRLGVRAEYHQTGIRYYTHLQFPEGITQQGTLLGDPLGPRGLGSYLTVDGETARGAWSLTGAYEVRSGNRYGSGLQGADSNFVFVRTAAGPGEHRARLMAAWTPGGLDARTTVTFTGGIEHVNDFNFVAGAHRTNGLLQAVVKVRP
jgi:hypothetical protein